MNCIFTDFSVNFENILKTFIISKCIQICACIYITTEKGNSNHKKDWTPKNEEQLNLDLTQKVKLHVRLFIYLSFEVGANQSRHNLLAAYTSTNNLARHRLGTISR